MAGKQVVQADQQGADLDADGRDGRTRDAQRRDRTRAEDEQRIECRIEDDAGDLDPHREAHFADSIEHRLQRQETEHRDHSGISDVQICGGKIVDFRRYPDPPKHWGDHRRTDRGENESDHRDH